MKVYRIILLAALTSLLTSCGSPIVNRALKLPSKILSPVTGPIFGAFR